MCVVAIAWNSDPRWRLVIAGNRDEHHVRPSAPLSRWVDHPGIIAGRDLVSGGGWIGVSDEGRFAVVTNIRDADGPDPDKASRGALVTDWLSMGSLPPSPASFNPFSMIVTDLRSAQFVSNRPGPTSLTLPPGIHGLSNAIADESWPRKDRLVAELTLWLAGPGDRPEMLLDLLAHETTPYGEAYPVFIRNPLYGTRCSTIIAVDHDGHGQIIERRFDHDGATSGQTTFDFHWPN